MNEPRARYVHLDSQGQEYVRILSGPPESVTMRSGLVVLAPGQSVGEHNTENFEELIIVLQGEALAQIKGQKAIGIREGIAVYIPPKTDHNIQNMGDSILRYIYVVAKAIT